MRETSYRIAPRGLATSFTEAELPVEYAAEMRNCFISQAGGAEERQGLTQLIAIPGNFTITGLHELVMKNKTTVQFASGGGCIFLYDEALGTSSQVYQFANAAVRIQHVCFSDKIIFYNGSDRNVYTTDGIAFNLLEPLIEIGAATIGTSATALFDTDIGNWVSTDVAVNDLVFNVTLSAYAIVTQVTSAFVKHTPISTSGTGLGFSFRNQDVTDRYRITDLIELNIIPSIDPNFLDNIGFTGVGTTDSVVKVSGVNFATTDIRVGDIIYNTTRVAATRVLNINVSSLSVTPVSGQVESDSIIFLKSAMPITTKAHVHFGRLYCVDERNRTRINYSGPDDPQDFTHASGTLQLSDLQPSGEYINSMTSFQKYFVIGASKNTYFYQGIDPSDALTFVPLGIMPQGTISPYALTPIGNEALFASNDGIQSISLIRFATQLGRSPISSQVNTTLRAALKANSIEDIQSVHYPKRSFVLFKVGSEIYVLNYQPNLVVLKKNPNAQETTEEGSWSIFDGKFAQSQCFLVRNDGNLICGQTGGVIAKFEDNTFDDLGEDIHFVYKTGWLTTTDPNINVKQKLGVYIKPLFEVGSNITGTISVEAPFEGTSTDSVEFTAGGAVAPIGLFTIGLNQIGGSGVTNEKLSLIWKGEVFRLTFDKSDKNGPFVLSRYTVYSNEMGRI